MDQGNESLGAEVRQWVAGVFTQWKAGMTGGILMLLIASWAIVNKANIQPLTYGAVAGWTLIEALFLAWRDQRQERRKAEATLGVVSNRLTELETARTPNLLFKLEVWELMKQQLGSGEGFFRNIIAEISVRNSGARTALADWRLEIPSITEKPVGPRNDHWQEMIAKNSQISDLAIVAGAGIENGDIVRGILVFLVPGLTREALLNPSVRAHVTCKDAQGKIHVICSTEKPSLPD